MKRLFILILTLFTSPLFAEGFGTFRQSENIDLTLFASPFVSEVPHLETPDAFVKTYVVDMKTYEIVRSFDGLLRDYWPDLDIVLTETGHRVYYVNGGETLTEPKRKPGDWDWPRQGEDYSYRMVLTLWNRSTGEKIREVMGDRHSRYSYDYTSSLPVHYDRKAPLWDDRKRTTEIVDLVTGESLGTADGFVRCKAQMDAFLRSEPFAEETSRYDRLHPDGTKRLVFQEILPPEGEKTVKPAEPKKPRSWSDGIDDWDDEFPEPQKPRVWEVVLKNAETGENLWSAPFCGSERSDYTLRFSEDEKLVIGNCQFDIDDYRGDWPRTYVWNAETGKEIAVFYPLRKYFGTMNRMIGEGNNRYNTFSVLRDAGTGEEIAEMAGRFEAASDDERRFVTERDGAFYVWDTETGKHLGVFRADGEVDYRASVKFEADNTRVRVVVPTPELDTRFAAKTVVYDIASDEIVLREDTLPDKARFGDIVWKTEKRNAAFWNAEADEPFFAIQLSKKGDNGYAFKIFGEIFFSSAGEAMIFSPKMEYLEDD